MKKFLPFLFAGLLIFSTLSVSGFAPIQRTARPAFSSPAARLAQNHSLYEDILDQSQVQYSGGVPLGYVEGQYWTIAQSFIPQKRILTQVQLLMGKYINASQPCVVSIRENLTADTLAVASVLPEAIPTMDIPPNPENFSWVTYNFDDIPVTIGQTYYIVVSTANVTDNVFFIGGNASDPYPEGAPFYSLDGGTTWQAFADGDGCFKTYGRDVPAGTTGMYFGQWGFSVSGVPVQPLGWFTGFSSQKLLLRFEGIFAPFNVSVENATTSLSGAVIGPFMLGMLANASSAKSALYVGLGGMNATSGEFYFRIMLFVGPDYYMFGRYYPL